MVIMLTKEEIKDSYDKGICPFCDSDEIGLATKCIGYAGYVYQCEGYTDGACKYCNTEDRKEYSYILLCNNCNKGYNLKTNEFITDILSYSMNIGRAFYFNIEKAKELQTDYPNQAIVMAVAAMESFLEDTFISIIDSNSRYKVGESLAKRYSFQNIEIAKDAYLKAFGLNIKEITNESDENLFQNIRRCTSVRNVIIHNAGKIDKQALNNLELDEKFIGADVEASTEIAEKTIRLVTTLVKDIKEEINFKFKTSS